MKFWYSAGEANLGTRIPTKAEDSPNATPV